MPIYHQGRKVKAVYHQGRKVKEIWHMGRKIYTSFKPRVFTVTMNPGGLFSSPSWNTGSVTGDNTLVQSITGGGLYLAANATYTRTDGKTTGLRYADTDTAIAAGEVVRAGQKLFADPGTYTFTETQRKPVEVMPATPGDWEAQRWLRGKLEEYGENYETVTELPFDIDSSNTVGMYGMFDGCANLTTVPDMDTRNVTDMSYMLRDCSALTTVPEMDTRNVTDMRTMFQNCTSLTTVPDMDTGRVADMSYMFKGCSSLTNVPDMDTRNVTTMRYMFTDCSSLTTAPKMNTSQVTTMRTMFQNCHALTFVPEMDTSKVMEMNFMFSQCRSLTDGNVTLTIKRKGATTSSMTSGSGLTREPFLTIE